MKRCGNCKNGDLTKHRIGKKFYRWCCKGKEKNISDSIYKSNGIEIHNDLSAIGCPFFELRIY